MTQPTEFSLESVRQLMLANGGRVTNHELVKSFRRWLTDPQGKETARSQFKDYVNTLATIKQENNEKYLILKKRFYPEYYKSSYADAITPSGYSNPHQFDSFSGGYSTDNNYNSANYPSENFNNGYQASRKQSYDPPVNVNNFHQNTYNFNQNGHPNNYSQQPQSYHNSMSNGNGGSRGSPSLLEEVMAGFSPPSRTMARQLPPVPPSQSAHSQSINSLGLPLPPSGPNSIGLPTRQDPLPTYQRQTSVDTIRGSSSDLRGSPHMENVGYNQGFNPHLSHSHSQRNSVASVASYSSSSNSYHGSPRGSYAMPPSSYTGSPRNSYASQSNSYASPSNYTGSPRAGVAPSFTTSPRNAYPTSPNGNTQIVSPTTRPPPPYRAPPPDPSQHRPLPDKPKESHRTRPAELNLPVRPADSILPPLPVKNDSPPPPPKRTVPCEGTNVPPPLPRRPPPAPSTSLLPLDTGHTNRSRSQSNITKLSDSQQPSPTDSGFTDDSSKGSDSLTTKNVNLSKSFGNLVVHEEDKASRIEGSVSMDNLDSLPNKENEKSISVKERTKTFNRMASETEIPSITPASSLTKLPSAVKRRNSRAIDFGSRRGSNLRDHDNDTTDSSSITTIDPTIKQWMVHTARGDYQTAAKMLNDDPKLARHKDFTSGYTALHWACKHGNLDLVKLLAGTFQANVNAKSHGGYTPLHIAAQCNHQEVFDLLVQAYRADANTRDYAGKKPRQYMIVGDTGGMGLSMSNDTFRQLKDRRKNRTRMEKNPGILRFGSLSVKVKKTTEAFNNYFNSRDGNESKSKWGNSDVEKMPPPKFAPIKKRKSKRTIDFGRTKSAPVTPTERSPIKEVIHEAAEENISDSDSEYGFGDKWGPGVSHA